MTQAMLNLPFDMVKQRMVRRLLNNPEGYFFSRQDQSLGTATPCFTASELERLSHLNFDPQEEQLIKDVAAIAYAGEDIGSSLRRL